MRTLLAFLLPLLGTRGARRLGTLLVVVLLALCCLEPLTVLAQTQVEEPPTATYGSCSGGTRHRVKAGETLSSIAARYGTTANRIARCSGLTSRRVDVGQNPDDPVHQAGQQSQ